MHHRLLRLRLLEEPTNVTTVVMIALASSLSGVDIMVHHHHYLQQQQQQQYRVNMAVLIHMVAPIHTAVLIHMVAPIHMVVLIHMVALIHMVVLDKPTAAIMVVIHRRYLPNLACMASVVATTITWLLHMTAAFRDADVVTRIDTTQPLEEEAEAEALEETVTTEEDIMVLLQEECLLQAETASTHTTEAAVVEEEEEVVVVEEEEDAGRHREDEDLGAEVDADICKLSKL